MDFKTILDTLPSIDHLSGLTVLDNGTMGSSYSCRRG